MSNRIWLIQPLELITILAKKITVLCELSCRQFTEFLYEIGGRKDITQIFTMIVQIALRVVLKNVVQISDGFKPISIAE